MEDYLNNLNDLKACYERVPFNQVMSLENDQLKNLCLQERLKVIRDITSDKLLTTNLINERIRILHERENARIQSRREVLDKKFA